MWGAEDALAFYGTILGAVATIIAVTLTIVYTNKQNRQAQEYQRKLILADINKIELSNRNSEILDYARKITSILMLERLETTNLLDIFSQDAKITAFLHEFLSLNSYIDKLEISGSEAEVSFVTKVIEIITKIREIVLTMSSEMETVEAKINQYNEKKREFEEKQREYRKSPEYITKKLEFTIGKKKDGELPNDKFTEPKPESTNDIWAKYKTKLFSYRDEYKNNYMDVYNGFIDYKKQRLKASIDKLYVDLNDCD